MERFASKKWPKVYEKISTFIHGVYPFQYLFSFCDIFHLLHHCFFIIASTHSCVGQSWTLFLLTFWGTFMLLCSPLPHQRSPFRISKRRIGQYQFMILRKKSYPLMGICCFSIRMIPKPSRKSYFIWKATILKFTWSGWSSILSHLQALRTPPWRYEIPYFLFFLCIHFQASFSQILYFEMLQTLLNRVILLVRGSNASSFSRSSFHFSPPKDFL